MLYIKRNKQGDITGLTENQANGTEALDLAKEDVLAYLKSEGISPAEAAERSLSSTDFQLIRVLEDLIEVLVKKNVIQLTDLPTEAISKLYTRTNLRQQRFSLNNLINEDEEQLPL
ncbi:MAG: tryptophan synthase subunit beta [Alphaproteobacteria bacterium]|nr:tryptophan synthase subunit beta [Alphaproteobacteria bacterium]MDD9919434.1 tryptophan synthase subunit beta [Alphaproteobacteria bacterium]